MQIEKIILRQIGPFDDATIALPKGENPDLADVYLFTGPNGSGKSTALYALAGIIGCGRLGVDLSVPRLRGSDSLAALAANGCRRASAWRMCGSEARNRIPDPFEGGDMKLVEATGNFMGYFQTPGEHLIHEFWQGARNFSLNAPAESRPKFSWCAFAYAGMRSVSDARMTAITEPTHSPFENSLSFIDTANTERLAEWIANQEFKRLRAKEAGRPDREQQLAKSVNDIERHVADVIDDGFAFVFSEDDINVRVQQNGEAIDLGLLPDGLKSIVSWIADLLMRLDRIPWVDDTPTLQRPFLLLLDEVDVHLHPAWQRKVLPIAQRMFPKAQIIASTHSPFVVTSVDDAQIITLKVENGVSTVEQVAPSQSGVSYSSVLRSIFGIESEFDVDTEQKFAEFHEAKLRLLSGSANNRADVEQLADDLAKRSEEVGALVAIELRQMERQLSQRSQ